MNRELSAHPILLVHPDRDEAEYLVRRLGVAGIKRPIVILGDVAAARDFLETAMLAGDERFVPCAVLLDEKLGEPEVRGFTRWLRGIPAVRGARVARLSSGDESENSAWGADESIDATGALHALTGLLARACGP